MTLALIAPEIDRLVWAVNGRAKSQLDRTVLEAAGLSESVAGLLNNLIPFLDDLTESFVYRRYLYMDPSVLAVVLDDLVTAGVLTRHGDQLAPTPLMVPIRVEFLRSNHEAAHHFWEGTDVAGLVTQARTVLDASPSEYGLAQLARVVAEPEDMLQRLHQLLAGLRLLRNESHVAAWRAEGLEPGDVEMLTAAFSGSETQSPTLQTQTLVDRGLAGSGVVTQKGLELRQSIEDATNAGVRTAFGSIDATSFLEGLQSLSG